MFTETVTLCTLFWNIVFDNPYLADFPAKQKR